MSNEPTDAEGFDIDLSVLSDEDLAEFEAVLVADYEEKRGVEELGAEEATELTAIAEALVEVRAHMDARLELAAADDVVADVKGSDFLAKIAARKAAAVEAEADAAAALEAATAAEAEAVAKATEVAAPEAAAVAAKAEAPTIIISPTGLASDKAPTAAKPSGIVAAASTRSFTQGQELPDFGAVAAAFFEKRGDVRGTDKGTDGSRFLVASVVGDYSEDRTLGNDLNSNMAKINAVTSVDAIIASGGICAPNTPYYTLTTYGDAHRPVRDAFPVYKADRGGIRFLPAPRLTSLSGSVRRTTAAQDLAGYTNQSPAGTTAPKPCLHVTCEAEQSCIVQAVSKCITFGNMGSRTYPEQVEAWLKLGLAEFARYSEVELLNAVSTASTAITAQQVYGSTVSLLEQISLIVKSFQSRHRLQRSAKLRALFPFWALEIIRTDLAAQAYGDQLERLNISDEQIIGFIEARGVNPTFYQDNTTGAGAPFATQTAGVLRSWPDAIEWFIFPEGSFVYLDGGTLDLGLVRDSTLNSQNDYQVFYEEFFGLCFIGLESYKVTSQVCPNGSVATDPSTGNLRVCKAVGS